MTLDSESSIKKLLLSDKEGEHLEFKEAKTKFPFDTEAKSLCGYYVALANEGGGKLLLGISDKHPRKIVGTKAYRNIEKIENRFYDKMHRKIKIEEVLIENKRVLLIDIPSRPIGFPLDLGGQYLMRQNDKLVPMGNTELQKIYQENIPDYSAKILSEVTDVDLDQTAIKSGRTEVDITKLSNEQMLRDLRLLTDEGYTVASIILLGSEESVKKWLFNSEVRYAYKQNQSDDNYQFQKNFQRGYLLFYDEIWKIIDSRNLNIQIQVGLEVIQRKAFDEKTIREAVNNAVIHRDYSENQSIIVLHSNDAIQLHSPGGFLEGVNINNILDASKYRNKLLADVLYKCGFVESLGSGVNTMFKKQLSLGKQPPNYNDSDEYTVRLALYSKITDLYFAKYVLKISTQLGKELSDRELILLNKVKESPVSSRDADLRDLKKFGLVELNFRGEYILSKDYYLDNNEKSEYIKRKGLSKTKNKEMILSYLDEYKKAYSSDFYELVDVGPKTLTLYLNEMEKDRVIKRIGNAYVTRGKDRSYWIKYE